MCEMTYLLILKKLFTARKRSLGQGNIFTRVCHSVHGGGACVGWGACMVVGGMCGCGGACVVAGGHAWLPRGMHGCRGHAWLLGGHVWLPGAACMIAGGVWLPGGMHGCRGACMIVEGCAWLQGACVAAGGHAWLWGACMVVGVCRIRRDTVNERAVRILLECILVDFIFFQYLNISVANHYTNPLKSRGVNSIFTSDWYQFISVPHTCDSCGRTSHE